MRHQLQIHTDNTPFTAEVTGGGCKDFLTLDLNINEMSVVIFARPHQEAQLRLIADLFNATFNKPVPKEDELTHFLADAVSTVVSLPF